MTTRSPIARLSWLAPFALAALACAPTWELPGEPAGARAAPDPPPELAEAVAETRTLLRQRLSRHPGLAVAVADRSGLLWSEGFGVADLATGRPAAPATRFRIYSVAKAITGTLAVRLHERGRLRLDAPVGEYLPELPEALARVTLTQLLSHTAGVRHYRDGEWPRVSRLHCDTAREAIEPFVDDPLEAEPGSGMRYTSFGFVLASAVLEAAGGAPFSELLEREILRPAGMTATGVDAPPYDRSTTSAFYAPALFGRVRETEAWDNSCKQGAGGFLSTVEDLTRFGRALLAGGVVSPEGRELLWTPRRLASGEALEYGLGWGLETGDDGAVLLASHSGGSPGGRSYLLIDPAAGLVVALAANLEGERLDGEARGIREAFLPDAAPPP